MYQTHIVTSKIITQYSEISTGKSFSEALILASTNPQYDKRLFIEFQVQYMKIASSEHGENTGRTCFIHKLVFVATT